MKSGRIALFALSACLASQAGADDLGAAYQRAAEYLPWRVHSWLTQHETHAARWSDDGSEFRYTERGPHGTREMIGTARSGVVRPGSAAAEGAAAATTLSPDGSAGIGLEGFNLHLLDARTHARVALTTDGREDSSYAALYEFGVLPESERRSLSGPTRPAQGVWSPDGRYFATYRYDQQGVGRQVYWYAVPAAGFGARPRFIQQPAPYPGEKNAIARLVVVDAQARTSRVIDAATFETFLDPVSAGLLQWSADSGALYVLQEGRGLRSVAVKRLDMKSGALEELFQESSQTYLMLSGARYPAIWHVLRGGREMLWFSERDGWGNLYRIDLRSGAARPLTSGTGVVVRLLRVDERAGWAYFVACGREPRIDPYLRFAYRVRLDGSRLERLTPESADHVISMPARGDSFLDVQSEGVGAAPRTVLRSLDGKVRATIAVTDTAPLKERGWNAPERVRLRSADDRYDMYAAVFKPSKFDGTKRYPVLDYVYGLSSLARTPWSFPLGSAFEMADSYWHAQAIAELGFIVVKLDAPGTPLRGHRFARESYGAGHLQGMLDHHVAGIRQLAARDASYDLGRVGIFGSSGGGYTSTRAMLLYPEFFKAAVSFSGSHDLVRMYGQEWGERYIGPYESSRELYAQLSNTSYAERLRGKLLLVHGEADSEVTISMTQQLVHALVQADRNFDLLYLPNAEHDLDSHPYAVRRRWDYFVEQLLGERAPEFRMPRMESTP